jgi:hypothetical protein
MKGPGYDPDNLQTLYLDNGDGSLFSVGKAGPNNFHPDGTVRGLRPSPNQPNPEVTQKA